MFHTLSTHRAARRLALAATATTALVLVTAGPAATHTDVEADNAQALAENVEVSFHAESESDTAGITQLRVVLPEGIAPADVTYGEGPKGWKFTAGDDGYTVKGPALRTGVSAEYSIVVKQLPDARELAFKTLQTYADGRTDRWIELDENGENPAPVLELKPAAPGAKPVDPSPSEPASPAASPTPTPTPTAPETAASASPQAADAQKDDEGGLSAGVWAGLVAAVVVAAVAVVLVVRRRGSAQH
ncbi:DUF1775 domain-containing protein [Streptomyces sp. ALI-76-A]|uniref:DUF1775 domain-containing protein n=1 Tax=Streptomyces sp. ALI-76-A TaxID=3025736 RepID=UPI00256F4932|nr:DUF1775 domain-containing protein [Streptomyces sp. ALI-76-A]MDL5201434.1 DUF1775 domain-containing protein [Streptomyces sp. ALI-76-A]